MIIIDYSICFGCGACAEAYPDLFEIHDEKAWVMDSETGLVELREVVFICPVRAISIEE